MYRSKSFKLPIISKDKFGKAHIEIYVKQDCKKRKMMIFVQYLPEYSSNFHKQGIILTLRIPSLKSS